jgi:hypothetical protein
MNSAIALAIPLAISTRTHFGKDAACFENRASVLTIHQTLTHPGGCMPGNRNLLFLIIGALAVVVGLLGYNLYEAKKEPKGVHINVGPDGLKIDSK